MKIKSIEITNYPPIRNLKLDNLGSVVIIAGANGAGKTRLKQAIVQTLQGSPVIGMTIQATRDEERDSFKSDTIETKKDQINQTLNDYINSRRYGRGNYVGSLVQIDADRNIKTINYSQINWQVIDPDDNETPSNFYYSDFSNRWQDFMNYIHLKVAAHARKLATEVQGNPGQTGHEILTRNPHPLSKYQEVFHELLPDKELQDIDPARVAEFTYKDSVGNVLPFSSLSSGEQEVVKVIFDVTRKDIKHSVIIVDEPELHLHPTLTYKLIETLKKVGNHSNQFIFLTHSADLISTYFSTGDVYFIDPNQGGQNQIHRLSELEHSHKELVQIMGDNLGVFSVGKKLIFVEGEDSSIDRLTYHNIAKSIIPEANIIPIGSVENIITLNSVERQIRQSIFGINFYMIRDRDGLTDSQIVAMEAGGRMKCLPRRHIENYFLDEEVLYKTAERLCLTTINPELSVEKIKTDLKATAESLLKFNLLQNAKEYLKLNSTFVIPTVKDLQNKDENQIMTEIITGVSASLLELTTNLEEDKLNPYLLAEKERLESALQTDSWKTDFRGKEIFRMICSNTLMDDPLKIRQAYVEIALQEKPGVFSDVLDIFEGFKSSTSSSSEDEAQEIITEVV